ncbi:very-long-chain enoyl-CoA reductase isoform X4 [Gallus gallus]|uniref:very-long-chain enoyl-CoA reductase isoform X4 n=1 Tax=Gallus gallus TaxID=9031 RepID=UPI001AE1FC04|nr:very-long-chain enoyl-CoA reductase isoform X4 [Gallus gallus]
MKHYEVEILDAKTREKLCFLDKVEPQATIAEIKNLFTKTHPQWYPARQSLRLEPSECPPPRPHRHRALCVPAVSPLSPYPLYDPTVSLLSPYPPQCPCGVPAVPISPLRPHSVTAIPTSPPMTP